MKFGVEAPSVHTEAFYRGTSLNFIKFLDHCAKLILLKKVGGGYIFIHRMLLDYFADLPTPAVAKKSASVRSDPG